MFPEKLTYDGFQYRTTCINEALNLMSLINNKIQSRKKMGQIHHFWTCPIKYPGWDSNPRPTA